MTPADTCRANGWTVGTRLVGDEGWGPTVIEITAIGHEVVLARHISHGDGRPGTGFEGPWRFDLRKWTVAE